MENSSSIIVTDNNLQNQKSTTTDLDEENIFIRKHAKLIFFGSLLIIIMLGICLIVLTILFNDNDQKRFWINQGLKYFSIILIQCFAALLVTKFEMKVNYTRKMVHIAYFIIPQILDRALLDFKKDVITECWNVWVILILLLILAKPIRSRVKLINFMYKAVDRPEDKPYTLFWLASQTIATLFVAIPFAILFNSFKRMEWIFIPILINGLADGLAEPVGIRFGKHKYQTKSCFSDRLYTRSYEGSLCVFLVSTIIILAFYNFFRTKEYIFNVLLIPICITFTEAFAPHTWDSPFIFFVSSGLLSLSYII
ncbi:hypothetical protein CPAV1605_261 [seawater metagenome]|uniref:Cytidylyltransferase family n=1 Tax=seawater metagenome TaxID=1561972 RepID=A0A5E8CHL2_9ZZZZ